jgi:hypothetical protein
MSGKRIKIWLKRCLIVIGILILSSILTGEYEYLNRNGFFDHIRSRNVSLSQFKKEMRTGNIICIEISRTRIYGYLKHPVGHLIDAPIPTHPSLRDQLAIELRDRAVPHMSR